MAEVAGNNKKGVYDLAGEGGWLSAYCDLLEAVYEDETGVVRKLSRQQAAFVAWDCAPKQTRQPETMLELATLLNYKSEQVFYKWRKTGWYKTLILAVRQNILLPYLHDIDRKTIGAALTEEGGAGVQARKLFYEVTGVLNKEVVVGDRSIIVVNWDEPKSI